MKLIKRVLQYCQKVGYRAVRIRFYRDKFMERLKSRGIITSIHYPMPPHQQPAYHEWNNRSYPITEAIHREVVSLPMSPVLNDNEISSVIEAINAFF